MEEIQRITWFAGLFEGEGSFVFANGKPKAMHLTSTDKDVLDRIVEYVGGSIYPLKKRQSHHKDAWIWASHGSHSVSLAKSIKPYLLARRKARCEEYIRLFSTMENFREIQASQKSALTLKVIKLRTDGLTHQAIADRLGVDRTYVTHILRRNKEQL